MSEPRKRPGRPATGRRFEERLMIYIDAEGKALLRKLAEHWGARSDAEAMRRAIHEAAEREGLT